MNCLANFMMHHSALRGWLTGFKVLVGPTSPPSRPTLECSSLWGKAVCAAVKLN